MLSSVILPERVYTDSTGAFYELPVLYTEAGYLIPLLDYCIAHSGKSNSWLRKVVGSVQLFLEYMHANPDERNSHLLFQNFLSRLETGTFDVKTGHDPSRLGWTPRSPAHVRQIVVNLSDFLDWLGRDNPAVASITQGLPMSAHDKAVSEAAATYRRKYALLGHLWKPPADSEITQRRMPSGRAPKVNGEPPAFPEDRFDELLERGFKVGNRNNYRDQAITLLMHGAGFRVSEPMHLFTGDVIPDPLNHQSAMVLIHHPKLGTAPTDLLDERDNPVECNRATYLQKKYGLTPRNDLMSKKESGWKGTALDEKYYMRPYWFKPDYGEQFMYVWYKYMEEVAEIPIRLRNHHPYAFINLYREPRGSIYVLDKFVESHRRACERIGLIVDKELGTTPHGHRHAYGRRLSAAGFNPAVIKKCMHHGNEKSQEVYTGLSTREVLAELEKATERMQQRLTT